MRIYDKNELIALVQKAIGEQNIKSFAEKAGLSRDYISRLLLGRFGDSPRKSTLEKIASATDLVSLDELMQAAGYNKVSIPNKTPSKDSVIKASLLSSLASTNLSWSIEGESGNYSLTVKCNNSLFDTWSFIFLDSKEAKSSKSSADRLFHYYLNFLFRNIPSSTKISFVTDDKEEFDLYKKNLPVNLAVNISLILVDSESLGVDKEVVLSSSKDISETKIKVF